LDLFFKGGDFNDVSCVVHWLSSSLEAVVFLFFRQKKWPSQKTSGFLLICKTATFFSVWF
jgi:hypothetical protein